MAKGKRRRKTWWSHWSVEAVLLGFYGAAMLVLLVAVFYIGVYIGTRDVRDNAVQCNMAEWRLNANTGKTRFYWNHDLFRDGDRHGRQVVREGAIVAGVGEWQFNADIGQPLFVWLPTDEPNR